MRWRAAGSFAIVCLSVLTACSGKGASFIPAARDSAVRAHALAAAAPPALVQIKSYSPYAPTAITVAFAAAPAAGNVLVVFLNNNGTTTGAPNTYTPPSGWTQLDADAAHRYISYQAFYHVVASGEANSYVFTPSCACRAHSVIAAEYTNVDAAAPVDKHGFNYVNASATWTTPNETPAQANDLAVAAMMPTNSSRTWTNAAGWTLDIGPLTQWSTEALHEAQSGVTAVSETSTLSASGTGYAAIVLLKGAGATGTPTPVPTPTPTPVPTTSPTPVPTPGGAPKLVQRVSYSPYAPARITVTFAAAPAAGDLLVVFLNNNGTTTGAANTYVPPSGWTQIDADTTHAYITYQAFYHIVASGETNGYVFTPSCACRAHNAIAVDYSGTNASSPIDRHGFAFVNNSAAWNTPVETPSQANDLAVVALMPTNSGRTWSNAAGWTLDLGPLAQWSSELLHQAQSAISPISESSTFSAAGTGDAAIVLVRAAGSTATPPPASYSDWNTFGGNLARWGYNPNESTLGRSNVANLSLAWKYAFGGAVDAQPLVATGVNVGGNATAVVYAGAENGTFAALNADTGQLLWKRTLGVESTSCNDLPGGQFGITGTPTFDKSSQLIYVADGLNKIHALNMATGAEAAGWPVDLSAVNSPPANPAQDHIYGALSYNPANHLLYAETASICDTSPWHGRIVAIDTTNPSAVPLSFYPAQQYAGAGIWGMGGASIDTATNDVYIATGNDDGAPSQSSNFGDAVVQLSPQLAELSFSTANIVEGDQDYGATPLLYTASGCAQQASVKNKDGSLYTFDLGGGTLNETQQLTMAQVSIDGAFIGVPAFDPATNLVYVGVPSSAGAVAQPGLVALRGCGTLSVVFDASIGPSSTQNDNEAPTAANGVVYFTNGIGNQVYALDAATGSQLWNSGSTIGGSVFAAPTADGRLFVSSWDGNLYAFGL